MAFIGFNTDPKFKSELIRLAKQDKRDLSNFINKVLSDYVDGLKPRKIEYGNLPDKLDSSKIGNKKVTSKKSIIESEVGDVVAGGILIPKGSNAHIVPENAESLVDKIEIKVRNKKNNAAPKKKEKTEKRLNLKDLLENIQP